MRFVIAGASGLLGTALRDRLAHDGHDVVRLVRGQPETASESHWDPYSGQVDQAVIDTADVVVCLSGAPLTHWPWTEAYKKTFTDSRVRTTRAPESSARRAAPSHFTHSRASQSSAAGRSSVSTSSPRSP